MLHFSELCFNHVDVTKFTALAVGYLDNVK